MSDESGGEDESRWRGDIIAYALEDGHEILVSPSFAQPDVASCSVMITREKPGPVPKEWKKDTVASALLGALAAANGEAHPQKISQSSVYDLDLHHLQQLWLRPEQ